MHPTGLDKARELILSISTPQEAQTEIDKLKTLSPDELNKQLETYYTTAPTLAAKGDTKGISVMLRVFEYFEDQSHDRMLLHYIAQAEANQALEELKNESQPHHTDMTKAIQLISEAFADANQINTATGVK
jgi:hypothetical protein